MTWSTNVFLRLICRHVSITMCPCVSRINVNHGLKSTLGKGYVSSQEGNIYIYISPYLYIYTYTGWWSVSSIFYFHLYLGKIHCPNGLKPPASSMQCFGWSTWEMRIPNGEPWAVEIYGRKHILINTPLDLYRFLFHTYLKFYISMESMGLSLLWSSLPWTNLSLSRMAAKRSEPLTWQSTMRLPYSFSWCTHPVLLGE